MYEHLILIYEPHNPFIFIGVVRCVYQCRIYNDNFKFIIHISSESECSFIVQTQLSSEDSTWPHVNTTGY